MRHEYSYNSIDRGVDLLMDGGKPYSFDGVLWRPPGVKAYGARLDEFYGFGLGYGFIQNRTGGAIQCGIGARLHKTLWKAGQWVNGTTTFTDDTIDAQDSDANDFPLETLTASGGFVVEAEQKFNAICIDIGTASVGTNPTRILEYSLAAGTWKTLSNAFVAPVTSGHWAVGEALILWAIPVDWAPLEAGHGTGFQLGWYGIRVRSTTAPGTTAGVANSMSIARVVTPIEGLADNNVFEVNPTGEVMFQTGFDSVVAVLSSKAAAQSEVHVDVRVI